MANSNVVIRTRGLTKELPLGSYTVHALRGVDMDIYAGEMVGIVGPSGSGKSTLLGLIGGLDTATGGTIEIDGVDITRMNEDQLTEVRNEKIGFIFQGFNLLSRTSAVENVILPMLYVHPGVPHREQHERAMHSLELVGLADGQV
jgi:putative ABC transport system ATP-binding protein